VTGETCKCRGQAEWFIPTASGNLSSIEVPIKSSRGSGQVNSVVLQQSGSARWFCLQACAMELEVRPGRPEQRRFSHQDDCAGRGNQQAERQLEREWLVQPFPF
jgi:hypothetical protein